MDSGCVLEGNKVCGDSGRTSITVRIAGNHDGCKVK